MTAESNADTPQPKARCETEDCHRETAWVFAAGENADGEPFPDGDRELRSFCDPCKRAAEWKEPWHPADATFRPAISDE